MQRQIDRFLTYLMVEQKCTENTTSAYHNDLMQFLAFISRRVHSWEQVTEEMLQDYVHSLGQRRYATSTVARKVAAIKSFFHFMLNKGFLEDDPTATLDSPRIEKRLPKVLSPQEVEALLEAPTRRTSGPKALRDKAFLELLYASGMRVSELVALDVDDVSLEEGTVRCKGKGGKERILPLPQRATDALRAYLERGRPVLLRDEDERALFLNHRGKRLTRQGLWLIIKGYVKAVGLDADVTPHTLRHSFATHLLNGGIDLHRVQRLLGHANISTTQIYNEIREGTRDEAVSG